MDISINVKRKADKAFIHFKIHLLKDRIRKTEIFDKIYNICELTRNIMSSFATKYLFKEMQKFFKNGRLCPIEKTSFTAQGIAFNSELFPLHLFYRPGYLIVTRCSLSEDRKFFKEVLWYETTLRMHKKVC